MSRYPSHNGQMVRPSGCSRDCFVVLCALREGGVGPYRSGGDSCTLEESSGLRPTAQCVCSDSCI